MSHNPTIQSIINSPCGGRNQHLVTEVRKKIKRSKYRNAETVVDGIRFDSKKEAVRYGQLKIRLKLGEIGLLERQKHYLLIEANETERKCEYVADFVYWDIKTGKQIVEDVKSSMTRKLPTYIMKRKLMKDKYNIEIQEV